MLPRSLKCSVAFVLATFPLHGHAMRDQNGEAPEVLLELKVEYRQGDRIQLSLTNKGIKDLKCDPRRLPWRHDRGMTLLLVRADTRAQLRDSWAGLIDDPDFSSVELKPNRQLTSTINLRERFPEIAEVLPQSALDVFWSYEMQDEDGGRSKRTGGWFYIPKTPVRPPK